MEQIDPANIFIGVNQTLADIVIVNTSLSVGSGSHLATTAGSGFLSIDPSHYAASPFYLVNAKASTTVGSHFEFTIQYLDETLNVATKTYILNSSATANASYSLDISGYGVENFIVRNVDTVHLNNFDNFDIVAHPLRTATY
jgi:hypothetical protein